MRPLRDARSITREEQRLGHRALHYANYFKDCAGDDECLEAMIAGAAYELVRRRRNRSNGLRLLLHALGKRLVSMFVVRNPGGP